MSNRSAIEWTETTWNPVTGCHQVSLGCDNMRFLSRSVSRPWVSTFESGLSRSRRGGRARGWFRTR